ncbi:succinyldiaminopimelate transaminase [Propionibacteriaceae bacterium Y1923]|uniref:succinyldiaminopimelate transaminase n=1 Tax=Aestuariimicrobium sp. Y1814 TaxID=3418742 RepID=UPI003C1E9E1C
MSRLDRLPVFPWDTLAEAKATASAHPDGIVDLSVGTPVDPTPAVAVAALTAASDAHGYPQVWGYPELRRAVIDHLFTRWNAVELPETGVLPVIGTKWLVAMLPQLLDLGPGDTVVIPTTAYPTYAVGALYADATVVECDQPELLPDPGQPDTPRLIWVNSPANPHGAVMSPALMKAWIDYARGVGAVLASDECYGEFVYEGRAHSMLDRDLNGGSVEGIVVAMSTSKESNMAGYRAGYAAGDPAIVGELLGLGKHLGMMLPTPVLRAMEAVLRDRTHVTEQLERYRARREVMAAALRGAGFTIDHSEGSLYLWATRGENCRDTVAWLAERGILVAPGDFYGKTGEQHVRVGLTATDERIAAAAQRLAG